MLGVKPLLASLIAIAAAGQVQAVMRCLPWAVDNRWAPKINSDKIGCYHHWADGYISQFGSKEYVPNYWGKRDKSKWEARKRDFKKHWPKHILAFNEPDISSQSNMSPSSAATEFMNEIYWPYHGKGIKFGSPAPAWKLDWLSEFLKDVKNKGGKVDFIALHWYGSYKDISTFKKFILTAHKRWPSMDIWITELGITTASHPSRGNVKSFATAAFKWMDTQPYIKRAFWFGAFANAPDGYATKNNALFTSGGGLTDLGNWYKYGSNKRALKRHQVMERSALASADPEADTSDDDEPVYEGEPVHCDDICEQRKTQLLDFDDDELETRSEEFEARSEEFESREAEAEAELLRRMEALEA